VKTKDIIRAWKDAGYRQSLSEADQAKLPANPAGMIELTEADLGVVSGGNLTGAPCSYIICPHTHNCTGGDIPL